MTSLLPPNATTLERALETLARERMAQIAVPLRDLWSAQRCPEALLPWLAWALSIDQWSTDWPLHIRRARVAQAIAIQRIKGSAKSVSDVVQSFGGGVVMREWFETGGVPHTFSLLVSLGGQSDDVPSADFIDSVVAEVTRTKPVRSHFTFTLAVPARARLGLRAVARALVVHRLQAVAPGA